MCIIYIYIYREREREIYMDLTRSASNRRRGPASEYYYCVYH